MAGPVEDLLTGLSRSGVRYLVVGGVAVVLHGYLRATADLDLVLSLDDENVHRAIEFFEREGFMPRPPVSLRSFGDREVRRAWRDEKNMQVLSLWHPAKAGFEVDLFIEEPFSFEEHYRQAKIATLGAASVTVISIDDLIAMKRATGRSRDLEDVAALEELRNADGTRRP